MAELLSGRALGGPDAERTSVEDRATVERWLHGLGGADQQVMVHRSWGTVAAVADGWHPVEVVMSDGESSWTAEPPDAPGTRGLTTEQMEHVVLDALTSIGPPAWPAWRRLA